MAYSIFLGQILGLGLLVLSLGYLLNEKRSEKALNEIAESSALWILVSGIMFFFGLIIVGTHNLWVIDWRILITLLGWILLVSGILRICFQNASVNMCKKAIMKRVPYRLSWVGLVIGGYLLYAGLLS
jgi:hypothetical protein